MTGIDLRKEIPAILAEEVQTSRAALQPKAKAAHSIAARSGLYLEDRAQNPLEQAQAEPPACSSGAGASLEGDSNFGKRTARRDVFNAFSIGKGRNRRLKLAETSSLPERFIGGPVISSKFRNTPRARQRVDRVPRDLAARRSRKHSRRSWGARSSDEPTALW